MTKNSRSVTARFDRDVFAVVRKYLDDPSQEEGQPIPRVVQNIYEYIKQSNSSLSRLKKNALEDSIERAVETIRIDEADATDVDMADDGRDEPEQQASSNGADGNYMNRLIAQSYKKIREQESQSDKPAKTEVAKPRKRKRGRDADKTSDSLEPPTDASFHGMGGVDGIVSELTESVLYPILQPHVYQALGLNVAKGILLHGPPGCGKTMFANALAAHLRVPFISISAPSVVSGMSGESEKTLREHFENAVSNAPCLLFIDEIDAITPKRESAQREMEKRIVAQLLTCMDDLKLKNTGGKPVIVLAATNRPDSLDSALRRGGRFGKEINMPMPTEGTRKSILEALTRSVQLGEDVNLAALARKTPAFVGADLNDLVTLATEEAIKRSLRPLLTYPEPITDYSDSFSKDQAAIKRFDQTRDDLQKRFEGADTVAVVNDDFLKALPKIQPTAKREGFATIPSTTWADVGALAEVREALTTNIVKPILDPASWARAGVKAPSGLLLWGPPGCGKTLLAKAVANQTHANFISIKGPELLSKYVGDSERRVREVFTRARSSVPCIVFFDELDALAPRRDESLNEASSRVVNTLLVEMDGLDSREGIYVIGATNRPDVIDEAILRPGRLDKLHFVDLPSAEERVEILRTLSRSVKPEAYTDELDEVARRCDGFSGADLSSLISAAGGYAVQRSDVVRLQDFQRAREGMRPSVKNYDKYQALQEKLCKQP